MSKLSFPALLVATFLSAALWCTSAKAALPPGLQHMPLVVDNEDGGGFEPRNKYDENADDDTPTTVSAVGTLEQMEAFDRAHPEQSHRVVRNVSSGGGTAAGMDANQPNGVTHAPGDSEPLAPPLNASFIGTIDNNTLIPPDTDGAVGPNHVFEFTNLGRTIYNKAGGVVNGLIAMSSFWSSLGAPSTSTSDPHVLYDQYTGRWLVSGIGLASGQWVLVGVSQGADPAGPYNLFGIQVDVNTCGFDHTTNKVDFDLMGFDPNNVIVTINIFNSALTARIHSDVYIINKARMLASNAALVCNTDYQIIHDPCNPTFDPNLRNVNFAPSVTFGQTTGNAINYIVDDGWFDNTNATTLQNRYYRFAKVTGVGATAVYDCLGFPNGNSGFTGVLGCYNFNQAGAQQPSPCSQLIATNSYNITSPPIVRNGKIWVTHSAGAPVAGCPDPTTNPAATRSQVFWFEQDPANFGTVATYGFADQNGVISDSALAYYFPSLAVNSCDAVMIGFTGSSTSQFAASMYTGRLSTDPLNTMQAVGTAKAGEATYLKTFGAITARNRWGDYSATCVDPADDQTMWTLQEFARPSIGGSCPTNNTGRFGTWWASMPITCIPTGSCCPGDGSCSITTQANCAGTWTNGGTCNPNPCPPVGSCCPGDGSCQVTTQANCTGNWTQGGVCNPNPCPPPTGACCFANGACQNGLTQAQCTQDGIYQGNNTICTGTCLAPCQCPGDVNQDGNVNGLDIACFTKCLFNILSPGCDCGCADMDSSGIVDLNDVGPFVAALLAGPGCAAPPITFVVQPAAQHSTLIPTNYNPLAKPIFPNIIRDDDFAGWVQNALINANVLRVDNATLIFQQCFGGGFLDDLDNSLTPAPNVKWVGGAASQHDEPSYGQNKGAPQAPPVPLIKSKTDTPPMSYWTRQLEPQLLAGNRNSDSIDIARIIDPYGTFALPVADKLEHGQLLYRNAGQTIKFKQGNGKHYAILFAGYTDAERHFENINRVYNRLAAAWNVAVGADEVRVIYGDATFQVQGIAGSGALPAAWGTNVPVAVGNAPNLMNAIAAVGVVITANDQFFFYASDHGGNTAKGGGGLIPGSGGPTPISPGMMISPGMTQRMQQQPDNVPTLTVDYSSLVSGTDAIVRWNSCVLGHLTYSGSSSGSVTFAIDESCINDGANSVTLDAQPGSSNFNVDGTTFFTGKFNDIPPP